jgi:hypothetical protein
MAPTRRDGFEGGGVCQKRSRPPAKRRASAREHKIALEPPQHYDTKRANDRSVFPHDAKGIALQGPAEGGGAPRNSKTAACRNRRTGRARPHVAGTCLRAGSLIAQGRRLLLPAVAGASPARALRLSNFAVPGWLEWLKFDSD